MNAIWTPVTASLPQAGHVVLACYRNASKKWRVVCAYWAPSGTIESDADSEAGDYDATTDTYYDPEGWYECIDNWLDNSAIAINEGEVTHWMPLPDAPAGGGS